MNLKFIPSQMPKIQNLRGLFFFKWRGNIKKVYQVKHNVWVKI